MSTAAFKINVHKPKIMPIEEPVEFFATKVRIGKRMIPRISSYYCYFEDWDSAHEYLMAKAIERMQHANEIMASACSFYYEVESLKNPDEELLCTNEPSVTPTRTASW